MKPENLSPDLEPTYRIISARNVLTKEAGLDVEN